MSNMPLNPLLDSGKPLFFAVTNAQELGLAAPPARLGESVRTWVRALGGMQKEALVFSSRTGTAWRLASDEGDYLMGLDEAPCPLSFLTTGMVASYMSGLLAQARARGVKLGNIRLTQDNFYTMQGSMLQGTMTGGALPVQLAAEMDSDADPEVNAEMLHAAVDAAAITGLIRKTTISLFSLTHNSRPIPPLRVSTLAGAPLDDLGSSFDHARPALEPAGLLSKHGLTPRTEEATSSAGSSLAGEQNRRLHVRGICTVREDGLFQVEQHLFNPHGSIFRFTVDPENLRAPGPATHISAGIAFCFMTQFGRYAAIMKRPLTSYSVVQDTHFSTGGPGRMEPVETHVHLTTAEDDGYAQACLDMSEQTCFLHALSRLPLDVSLRTEGERAHIRT